MPGKRKRGWKIWIFDFKFSFFDLLGFCNNYMNRKAIGIVIIATGGIILAGMVYFIFFSDYSLSDLFRKMESGEPARSDIAGQAPAEQDAPPAIKQVQRIVLDPGDLRDIPSAPSRERDATQVRKDDLKRMASSFAERFGSYSNQSNFGNITELKIFMSRRMQEWADDYVNERRGRGSAADLYYGITTRAVAQEVKEIDDDTGKAVILVKTRRREASGSTINTSDVFDQDIIIDLVREGGAWKVDGAAWQ